MTLWVARSFTPKKSESGVCEEDKPVIVLRRMHLVQRLKSIMSPTSQFAWKMHEQPEPGAADKHKAFGRQVRRHQEPSELEVIVVPEPFFKVAGHI